MTDLHTGVTGEVPEPPRRIDQRIDAIYERLARDGFDATIEHRHLDAVDRSLLHLLTAFGERPTQPRGEPKKRLINVRPVDPPSR